jgi:hypothetical protein
MTNDRYGPAVEVELQKEDLHDLAAAAFAYAEQLESDGMDSYAEDIRHVRSIMTEQLDEMDGQED